jgi:hypothetical protein
MARTPSGTITSVCTLLAPAKTIASISNAPECVVNSVAHGYSVGDILLVFSSWGRLNFRAGRVKSVPTPDSFVLEDFDTTNTDLYAAGGGAGTVRKASTWVDLDRTRNHTSSGGDAKTTAFKWTESDVETVLNDGFSAVQRTFEMDADMIGSPAYKALKTLSQTQAPTIVRRRAKTGALSLIPGTVSFNEEEIESEGQPVVNRGTINGQNVSTRYAAAP